MDKTIDEAIKVIELLNEEIYDVIMNEDMAPFELRSIGHANMITFLDIRIWSSEEDEREYIDEPQCEIYEPIEQYLRRKAQEIVNRIKKIKLLG